MYRSSPLFRLLVLVVVSFATCLPGLSAHELRETAGVQLLVGWAEEPAYAGLRNAVQVRITRGGRPLEGLAADLRVTVSLGDQTTGPLVVQPVPGSPGEYRAELIPTAPGPYRFRVTASIDGTPLDQTFIPGPGTFDEVRTTTAITFPGQAPSNAELAEAVTRLQARADRALAAADRGSGARSLAVIALLAGGLALLVHATSWARGRRG